MSSDICGDANSDTKKVQILMSTYNGEEYIREQIDSISVSYTHLDVYKRQPESHRRRSKKTGRVDHKDHALIFGGKVNG